MELNYKHISKAKVDIILGGESLKIEGEVKILPVTGIVEIKGIVGTKKRNIMTHISRCVIEVLD